VPVRVGATDGTYTEIVEPLKPGDQVITGGGPQAKPKVGGSGGGAGGGGAVRVRT
jgi:HlyD family secretion protein